MKKNFLQIILIVATFVLSWFGSVAAQDASALLSEVNTFRAERGLPAYSYDASLSAVAQAQSEYQATLNSATHERADGSSVPARAENVCGGLNMTAQYCVRSMWVDRLHMDTMLYQTGSAGCGVAQSSAGNIFYTLVVNSSGSVASDTGLVSANENAITAPIDINAAPVQPGQFATSTAFPDGSIYHTVQSNETLWTIAINYGRTIAEIQALNGRAENDSAVVAGQRLLIVYGGTAVVPSMTPTPTKPPATNTPVPASTAAATLPPLPTFTPTITATPTNAPLIGHIAYFDRPESRLLGIALTVLCSVGLLITIYLGFLKE